jgi:hypothetical protein
MKKILLSLAAIMIAATSYANGSADRDLSISLTNIPGHVNSRKSNDLLSAQSILGLRVVKHQGQVVGSGVDLALVLNDRDEHVALIRPLDEYDVAGLKVKSITALSVSPDGKEVNVGLGAVVQVRKIVDGVDLEVGGLLLGPDVANGMKVNGKLAPVVKAKLNVPEMYKGAKNIFNEAFKKLSPVGGRV